VDRSIKVRSAWPVGLCSAEPAGGAGASAWTLHAAWDVRLLASALHDEAIIRPDLTSFS